MARDGAGNYSIPTSFTSGTTIASADMNTNFTDIATALTASIAKDGQTTPSANLPMGGYKHTNVAVASSRTDYARASQVMDASLTWPTVGGTGDAITLTHSPAFTAYATGMEIRFKAGASNTGAVTVNVDGIGAKSLKTLAGAALASGDLASGYIINATYDGTDFRVYGRVSSEALVVSAGGMTVTGNSTITGTLGGLTGLTVASGGATITSGGLTVSAGGVTITGNSTIAGTLGSLTGLTMTSGLVTLSASGVKFSDNSTQTTAATTYSPTGSLASTLMAAQFSTSGGNLQIKSGTATTVSGSKSITFAAAFSTACIAILFSPSTSTSSSPVIYRTAKSTTGFTVEVVRRGDGSTTDCDFDWVAFGY